MCVESKCVGRGVSVSIWGRECMREVGCVMGGCECIRESRMRTCGMGLGRVCGIWVEIGYFHVLSSLHHCLVGLGPSASYSRDSL